MLLSVHVRSAVVALAVGLGALVVPAAAGAQPAPALEGRQAGSSGAIAERFDGSKRATDAPGGPVANAVGDVTISSQGCSADPVAFGDQTTCSYEVQNQTQTPTTVDLQATGDSELAVIGADQGAAVTAGTARAEDVELPPRARARSR
ncbi:hypothetical protein ACE2AJ_07735 [Aquihabitans daechungensis]|uniref:hypothetical protein n=1 Tax=Aquihabitans daechungensis TaxID=1052257 RepID=UPI003BA14D5C